MTTAIILCLAACLSVSLSAQLAPAKAEPWDFLLLAQFWPGSSCIYFRKMGCRVPPGGDRWTVHGFWPSRNSQDQPGFCNGSMKFNYTEIESLHTTLDEYWPNYNSSGPRTYLWSHEWEKHGTCAYTLPALKGELKYFNETLRQYSYLNTYQALGKAGIIPSSDKLYKLDDIFSTLQKAYKSIPQIECYHFEDKHYLDQIYLCYDKSLQPMDCPSVSVAAPGTRPDLMQSLLFESENRAEDVGEPANRLNQYFVECPKDGLVYYVPVPKGQAQRERRVDFVPQVIES